jgi:hypothetical protein
MSDFYDIEPTLENYWRAIILFGRNVASYKFALAKSLYELKDNSNDFIPLESLAEPFSRHLCEHLCHSPKQITSKSSKFLDACNQFNQGDFPKDELIDITRRLAFGDVIERFHNVNNEPVPKLFYIDERRTTGGIRITDNFFHLAESSQFVDFICETEARWRLVEEAWNTGLSRNLIGIEYDKDLQMLYTNRKERRVNITSCRDSLNGYQKGRCFYCFQPIRIDTGEDFTDVDHFFPWILRGEIPNINGIWNLVLSCKECNRGADGKFARVPSPNLLTRLHKRNEYLINSRLPLRETLMRQTGIDERERGSFLQRQYEVAKQSLIHIWQPEVKGVIIF